MEIGKVTDPLWHGTVPGPGVRPGNAFSLWLESRVNPPTDLPSASREFGGGTL